MNVSGLQVLPPRAATSRSIPSPVVVGLLVAVSLLVACTADKAPAPAPRAESGAPEFAAGQVWTYLTRPGEEESRLLVCKVEPTAKYGMVVHIHVEGVEVKDPGVEGGTRELLGPMPFTAAALRGSVLALESTRDEVPDYDADYATWHDAVAKGEGKAFDMSVAEGVRYAEQALSSRR